LQASELPLKQEQEEQNQAGTEKVLQALQKVGNT
jgi:hypothetical protein